MTWLACIGLMIALVLASLAIVNKYGVIAFPSLIMLWLGSFAVVGFLQGYLPKQTELHEPAGLAQPAQPAKTPAK